MKFNKILRHKENINTRLEREIKLIENDNISYNPAYVRAIYNMRRSRC